ncbi:phasin family protein [Reyranella sp.]|uniref:phasin family protein n=1 Tax=Reyranella sp. TaxID=1929291 RepID=UPI003BACB49E
MTNAPFPYPALPAAAGPWSPLAGLTSAATVAADAMQACSEACSEWQQETARFVDARWTGNQRAWSALMAARDLGDLVRLQQDWWQQAAQDYTREATRIARLATSLSLTGTTPSVQASAELVA